MADKNPSLKIYSLELLQQYNDHVINEIETRDQSRAPHCLIDTKQVLLPAIKDNTDALTLFHSLGEEVASALRDHTRWNDRIEKVQMLLDLCWEKLHTGVWGDVGVEWRVLYAISCLIQACLVVTDDEQSSTHAIQLCDKALMMGHPILSSLVHGLVDKLTHVLIRISEITSFPQNFCKSQKLSEPPIIDSPIKTCKDIDLHIFRTQIFNTDPVVLLGMMEHWPSLSSRKWDLQYLLKVAGFRTVPVEIGSKYTDPDWRQELMLLSEFIHNYMVPENPPHTAYLAQHTLFDQIPILREDIVIPDYCAISDASNEEEQEEVRVNAWFGPPGTVSPLHYDPPHNLLCQVIGRKYIRLYSPSSTKFLYPHDVKLLHNTSRVDIEKPDEISFPKFKEAKFIETILSPGQMLYIPPRWWHFVKSLEQSFSVSFWWE